MASKVNQLVPLACLTGNRQISGKFDEIYFFLGSPFLDKNGLRVHSKSHAVFDVTLVHICQRISVSWCC